MIPLHRGRQRRHLVRPVAFGTPRVFMPRKPLYQTQVMTRFKQVCQHILPDRLGAHYMAGIQILVTAFDVLSNVLPFHRLAPDADQ